MNDIKFLYATINMTTFDIHNMSYKPFNEICPIGYKQIKVNDIQWAEWVIAQNIFPIRYYRPPYTAIMNSEDVLTSRKLIKMVPTNGVVVEVGSAYGGSARVAAEILSNDSILNCIDLDWKFHDHRQLKLHYKQDMIDYFEINFDVFKFESMYDFAKNYLSDYSNINYIVAESPYELKYWNTPVDLYFEDSLHWNPQLKDNLEFWVPFVKSGGIICGHDYNDPNCPDVKIESQILADKLGQKLNTVVGSTMHT
jgi:SAM-dependent methyltransferase